MSKLRTIAGLSLLSLLFNSAPLTASTDPLPEAPTAAPKFRVTKTLLQAQEFILQTLQDFQLVATEASYLPAQIALGFTQDDLDNGSLTARLESITSDDTAQDHAMKTLRSCFASHLAKHRADMNTIISRFNIIQKQIRLCQAMAIAHGTALLEYFIPDESVTTDARKAILLEKAAVLQDYIQKTLFQMSFDVPSLQKREIDYYFPEVDEEDACSQCGERHDAGTLCSAISVLANQESVDLAAANALPYACPCGLEHNATTECEHEPPFPVYVHLNEQRMASRANARIMTLAADVDAASENSNEDKIPGYVCEEGIWHAIGTLCEHQAGIPYYCSCGNWHTATSQCPEKALIKKDGVPGYTFGDGKFLTVNGFSEEHAAEGYLCQCGQWHIKTELCRANYDGSAYHPYPVYTGDKAGYVCNCGQWHEQGTSCSSENGSCKYLCSCGKMHYKTMDCIPNMEIRTYKPQPVYKDGFAGYVDSQHHWYPLNFRSQFSESNGDVYLCKCGYLHPRESYCKEGYTATVGKPYYCDCGNWHTATVHCENKTLVKKDNIDGYISGNGQWLAINTVNPEYAADGYPCQCGQWHIKTELCRAKYDGSAYHPYPVYANNKPGFVCNCGQWHEQGTSCSSENGSCKYLCSCGKMHYKTMDCIPNMEIKKYKPEPVYKDGVAGYVDAQYRWFAQNTRSEVSTYTGDVYLCSCGYMHPTESYCLQGEGVTVVSNP